MDKVEFMEGIHILQNNYHKKLSGEQLRLYYENLKDMSKETFMCNIKKQIKINPFMPNIAQLRDKQYSGYSNYNQRTYSREVLESLYSNGG